MAGNLNSNPSEFEEGKSDPSEFTADAVVEALKDASDEEKQRVYDAEKSGEERTSVLSASEVSGDDSDGEDSEDEEKDDPTVRDAPDPEDAPDPVDDYSKLDPTDERYNPYMDPAVGSSALGDVIVAELGDGKGKSPTLEACREAYKERQDSDES